MKAKWFSTLFIVTMLVISIVPSASAAPKPPDYVPVDVGPEIRSWDATPERISNTPADAAAEASAEATTSSTPISSCTLATKTWMRLNSVTGSYGFTNYYLVAEGPLAQIWVQTSLVWPAGDPRPTPEITCEQAQYMLGQFENNMYPKETSFFGMPDTHDGSNSLLEAWGYFPPGYYSDTSGRQVVLVSNIRDENYFDSTYPIYIAGFYSPSYEAYFDRNVMTIDAYDWVNRTGPSGTRPFLYEGVFAHEYQHLLHADYDPDEENFINEGMSNLAEYLTGYGIAVKSHVDAAAANPENSLTVWGDQGDLEILTDYGQAYLYQYYLMEQFGAPFIQALFHNTDNGITGVNSTLSAMGKHTTFADVYHDWSVAALINSKKPGGGKYQFFNVNPSLSYYFAPFNIGTPAAPNPQAYDTPGAPPWGTDYLWITGDPKKLAKLTFNGLDYSMFPTAWTSDGSVLWGGDGDLINNWAIFPATGGGSLTFDTKYDIEQYWDFGFVQVSTDGGYNWTSLANAYTTDLHDPSAHPTVVANLPGLTGCSGPVDPVTGCSLNTINMSYDLSVYAGQNILIAFRYVTDWATTGAGWYIDNVAVNGTLISDGSSVAPFKDITEIIPVNNDFSVTFVGTKGSGKKLEYRVKVMRLNHDTETGKAELADLLKSSNSVAMLVTFDAQEGANYYADYTYQLEYKHTKPWGHKPVHGHGNGTHFHNHGHGH
jgi:immune inhibitor A